MMTMLRDKKRCPPPLSSYRSSGPSPRRSSPSLSAVALCIRPACLPGLSFRKQTRRRLLDPLQYCVLLLVPPPGFQKRWREQPP